MVSGTRLVVVNHHATIRSAVPSRKIGHSYAWGMDMRRRAKSHRANLPISRKCEVPSYINYL